MKYSPAALRLLGYNLRSDKWDDFVSHTMQTWFKFSPDHSVSNFAWYNNDNHRNSMNVTHGGALMTFMDYCMAASIWDHTGGKSAYTIELNNKFIRPARIGRWIFGEIRIVEVSETITLEGRLNINDPDGMLILQSLGKFSLPKDSKTVDSTD